MNLDSKCPSCGAAITYNASPSARYFYACGSYGYAGDSQVANQTDLCRAWETLRQLSDLVTTETETKEQLVARVRKILGVEQL